MLRDKVSKSREKVVGGESELYVQKEFLVCCAPHLKRLYYAAPPGHCCSQKNVSTVLQVITTCKHVANEFDD